ncbi:phage virion morphogenesis protein [Pseudomonas sp. NFACC45]|uniref:phage virion morphogenesis protein n=1 Tax=Pseudomonas sp. NFACC45 TaxID=1566201 RepID=UPI000B8A40BF|nr:phage virion morphogenesis protein [Pseudomonas sp. NFACC45]
MLFHERISRVHQDGLRDRAERGAINVKYCRRQLLGLTDSDFDLIRESLRKHLRL